MIACSIQPIQLAIVEGYPLLRDGLLTWFRRTPEITVVGIADDGDTGLKFVTEYHPRVLLLDWRLPDMSGVEMATRAHAQSPKMAIVALIRNEVGISPSALRRMGIRALVDVSDPPSRIVEVIQSVAAGNDLAGGSNPVGDGDQICAVELTEREQEILRLMPIGKRNADIASNLRVSVRTVESYLSHMFTKLDVHSRTEAVAIARRLGMRFVDA